MGGGEGREGTWGSSMADLSLPLTLHTAARVSCVGWEPWEEALVCRVVISDHRWPHVLHQAPTAQAVFF